MKQKMSTTRLSNMHALYKYELCQMICQSRILSFEARKNPRGFVNKDTSLLMNSKCSFSSTVVFNYSDWFRVFSMSKLPFTWQSNKITHSNN